MTKFQFLAQFTVYNFTHPVVSTFILSLYSFTIFAYNMINGFVSIATKPTFANIRIVCSIVFILCKQFLLLLLLLLLIIIIIIIIIIIFIIIIIAIFSNIQHYA